ncbi:MAG: exodeoxyribonuclease VII small subunit [Verrucomicrobiota bacterium]
MSDSTETGSSFESSLRQLEELVESMEADKVSLDELIVKYEQGNQLYRVCEKKLNEAQSRIELIRKNGGAASLESFEKVSSGAPTTTPPASVDDESHTRDGELF